jgi:hypothetical protein
MGSNVKILVELLEMSTLGASSFHSQRKQPKHVQCAHVAALFMIILNLAQSRAEVTQQRLLHSVRYSKRFSLPNGTARH